MTLRYNLTGSDRKRLVSAISEITGASAKYLGAPSFAYQVDYFTIDRNGGVTFDDRADSEEIENLIETLDSQGFKAVPQAVEASEPVESAPAEVDGLCISMPASLFTELKGHHRFEGKSDPQGPGSGRAARGGWRYESLLPLVYRNANA